MVLKMTAPDTSKLVRSIEDSMEAAGLITNDARFAIVLATKVEVLDGWTGADIVIRRRRDRRQARAVLIVAAARLATRPPRRDPGRRHHRRRTGQSRRAGRRDGRIAPVATVDDITAAFEEHCRRLRGPSEAELVCEAIAEHTARRAVAWRSIVKPSRHGPTSTWRRWPN